MSDKARSNIYKERSIRVFLSSTFKDMKEEREQLVKHIFPQLRKLCDQRGVTWGEVDLRWGITDEQQAKGKVLPICLEEIDSCRPYFIGLLGERYGWVPKRIPPDLIEKEPWLEMHTDKSVVELEILHGVLNKPELAESSFFYFRDPKYAIPLSLENEENKKKLHSLKDRIRKSALTLRDNYKNPKTLGELVLNDIKAIIDEQFPEGSELDALEREAADHEALARNKSRIYIGRQENFEFLDNHVKDGSGPLVVLGDSGLGKTALLANWALNYRKTNPDDFMIMHFIGGTQQSTDWISMLRRIMGELKRAFDIYQEIPTENANLGQVFTNWLHMAAAKGRIVLLIDALNQLEDKDQALDLAWLPQTIPDNVRLIISTLPGKPQKALMTRDWQTFKVKPLTKKERRNLICEYLKECHKELDKDRIEKIASCKQSKNPLFLRSLLEELRVFGVQDSLDRAIEHYLSSPSIPALFKKILQRLEQDFDREWPGFVEDTMSLVWASRRGISEVELIYLLGTTEKPLPRIHWAEFYHAVEKMFVNRSGLIGFSHEYIRRAIEARYVRTKKAKRKVHRRLADYFALQAINPRMVDELPWQLVESQDWQKLYDLLANLKYFHAAWEKNKYEVISYWAIIENTSNLKRINAYQHLLDTPDKVLETDITIHIADLLKDTGYPREALSLYNRLETFYIKTNDERKRANLLRREGAIHFACSEYKSAMKLYNKSEDIYRELDDKLGLAGCLNNQGIIFNLQGEDDKAMKLYDESVAIARKLGHKTLLAQCLSNQGIVFHRHSEYESAIKLYQETANTFRELGDKQGLGRMLNNQGVLFVDRGDFDGAMKLYKQSEHIKRELGDKHGLSASLNNQGRIYTDRCDYENAIKHFVESEIICREIGDKIGLGNSLTNQGEVFYLQSDYENAMNLFNQGEQICRKINNKYGLAWNLINQGKVLQEQNELDQAQNLFKNAENIAREIKVPDKLSESLKLQAEIHLTKKEIEKALAYCEEALEISTKHGLAGILKASREILDKIRDRRE